MDLHTNLENHVKAFQDHVVAAQRQISQFVDMEKERNDKLKDQTARNADMIKDAIADLKIAGYNGFSTADFDSAAMKDAIDRKFRESDLLNQTVDAKFQDMQTQLDGLDSIAQMSQLNADQIVQFDSYSI